MGSKGRCGRGTHTVSVVCGGGMLCGVCLVCVMCDVGCYWAIWGVGVWGVHPLWGVWELCSVCGKGVLAVDCECVVYTHINMAFCSPCCPPEHLTCSPLPPFLREFSKADLPHTYM